MSKFSQIREDLAKSKKVKVVDCLVESGKYNSVYGDWEAVTFFVAPKNDVFSAEELNEIFKGLTSVKSDHGEEFTQRGGDFLKFGYLNFREIIGHCVSVEVFFLDNSELVPEKKRSSVCRKRVVHNFTQPTRLIMLYLYPTIKIAKDSARIRRSGEIPPTTFDLKKIGQISV